MNLEMQNNQLKIQLIQTDKIVDQTKQEFNEFREYAS